MSVSPSMRLLVRAPKSKLVRVGHCCVMSSRGKQGNRAA